MTDERKHPMQKTFLDDGRYPRFVRNELLEHLFNTGALDLNKLAVEMPKEKYREDWEQLAQLLGYSLSGFLDLSYVSEETEAEVNRIFDAYDDRKDSQS